MEKYEHLKRLTKEEKETQNQLTETNNAIAELVKKRNLLMESLKRTQVRITILKQDRPHVTDHALFRYIQRVYDIDMPKISEEVVTPMALDLLDKMGWADGKYPTGKGYSLVVKDGVIVTILV